MSAPIRIVVLTVALGAWGVGTAAAQTVVVRKIPAGTAVEVMVNTTKAGSAQADAAGDASIPLKLPEAAGAAEIDANIAVDVCGPLYRVSIVARGTPAPAPETGCERRPVSGLFLIRRVTTLVVHADSLIPSVLLIQGSYDLAPEGPARTWRDAPVGLVLFGGAGRTTYSNAVDRACGNVSPCSGSGEWGALTGGADYWVLPFLAATGSFLKPVQLDIAGEGANFDFNSFVDAYVLTVGGKVGLPLGPLRAYGYAGGAYHQGNFGTTQTNEDVTITVDGVEQVIPGGTQSFELQTAGWGWMYGGGLEGWITRSFALYGEIGRLGIKGDATEGEGAVDDHVMSISLGVRFRFGR
jgi:hypothetical protein